jgi:hypothetical protein
MYFFEAKAVLENILENISKDCCQKIPGALGLMIVCKAFVWTRALLHSHQVKR